MKTACVKNMIGADMTADMRNIEEKVVSGERLSFSDGVALFKANDLFAVGRLANRVREKKNGKKAFYILNLHINYSNVCYQGCKFCAFGKWAKSDGAFEMTLDDIFAYAEKLRTVNASEIHIVGGIHPKLPYRFYIDMLQGLRERFPGVHLKAFTAVEIDHLAKISKQSHRDVLTQLIEAGLNSLPGGGAEILNDEVWNKICGVKANNWLAVHRIAHQLGLKSTATMLYGHIETDEQRVEHILKVRDLQDETKGFTAFIPLAFHPEHTEMSDIPQATAQTDIKVHAIARLLLDNFDHVKAYWIMLGVKMAQMLLHFGVDDMDGTIVLEKIVHMAGAQSPEGMKEEDLRKLIVEAGRVPVLRDSLYNELRR